MEDCMPDLVFDEKIGNKRVRDAGEDEIHKGRLEKRPSGILGESGGGDHIGDETGGGIIDTFISNVFHKSKSGTEVDVGDEDLGVDGGGGHGGDGDGEGGEGGGGGIISSFFSNVFHHNGSADDDGDQPKTAEKTEYLGGGPGGVGENGSGGGEPEDLNAERSPEKKEEVLDLPSKDPTGHTLKLKPDDYSERVFFLNNN